MPSALRTLPLVLHARDRPTRRGRWFGVAAIAFGPLWLRVTLDVVAVLPILWYFGAHLRPTIGRALGWLEPVPADATIDAIGITVVVADAPYVLPWIDIAALSRSSGTWRFVGVDGAVLTTIPRELAYPQLSVFGSPTLAEAIVQVRPDRYVLRGGGFRGSGATEVRLR